MAHGLNDAMQQLAGALLDLQFSGAEVSDAAGRIRDTTQGLSERARVQASRLEAMRRELQGLAAGVAASSDRIGEVGVIVEQTRAHSREGPRPWST